jgi:hypothetical protein
LKSAASSRRFGPVHCWTAIFARSSTMKHYLKVAAIAIIAVAIAKRLPVVKDYL